MTRLLQIVAGEIRKGDQIAEHPGNDLRKVTYVTPGRWPSIDPAIVLPSVLVSFDRDPRSGQWFQVETQVYVVRKVTP